MKNKSKDYRDGFKSGIQHDPFDLLCRANITKANKAVSTRQPDDPIREYWEGYLEALQINND